MEANFPQVGDWMLDAVLVPSEDESADRRPSLKITAQNTRSGERRQIFIPREIYSDLDQRGSGLRDAFQQLGLWNLLWKGSVRSGVVSAWGPQGWPLFSQHVVPALYDILIPFYRTRGKWHTEKDELNDRPAYFPKELFADMVQILRQMRSDVFVSTTEKQLVAAVQRYLDRKHKITKPAK